MFGKKIELKISEVLFAYFWGDKCAKSLLLGCVSQALCFKQKRDYFLFR